MHARTTTLLLLLSVLLTTTHAYAFNLTAIEAIPESYVTPKCWVAYNTPIPGCNANKKIPCTDECIKSLASTDTLVRKQCKGNFVHPESILRQILDGGLMYVVCPAYSKTHVEIVESTMYFKPVVSSSVLALDLAPSPTVGSGVYFAGTSTVAGTMGVPVESGAAASGTAEKHSKAARRVVGRWAMVRTAVVAGLWGVL
jgi:hypothetical protein